MLVLEVEEVSCFFNFLNMDFPPPHVYSSKEFQFLNATETAVFPLSTTVASNEILLLPDLRL